MARKWRFAIQRSRTRIARIRSFCLQNRMQKHVAFLKFSDREIIILRWIFHLPFSLTLKARFILWTATAIDRARGDNTGTGGQVILHESIDQGFSISAWFKSHVWLFVFSVILELYLWQLLTITCLNKVVFLLPIRYTAQRFAPLNLTPVRVQAWYRLPQQFCLVSRWFPLIHQLYYLSCIEFTVYDVLEDIILPPFFG